MVTTAGREGLTAGRDRYCSGDGALSVPMRPGSGKCAGGEEGKTGMCQHGTMNRPSARAPRIQASSKHPVRQ